jgi:hypothetical protein
VQFRKNCGRPSCHCLRGGPLHIGQQVTFKVKGKSRCVYVPKDLLVSSGCCRRSTS